MSEFDAIRKAREAISTLGPAPSLNPTTIEDYRATAKRLIESGQFEADAILQCAADTRSTRTWFKRRAALKWAGRHALIRLLAEQDQLQRQLRTSPGDNSLRKRWLSLINHITTYTAIVDRMPVSCPIPKVDRKSRHSKRRDLAGLPDDWREQLILRTPKYYLPLLVSAATGCRPSELKKGVSLAVQSGVLIAIVNGAKVTSLTGQPWRESSWTLPRGGLVGQLADIVTERGGEIEVKINDPKQFSTAVRDAAHRLWPNRKTTITPYCFRHAFSSDLKGAKVALEKVAAGMGHAVDTTAQQYGSAKQHRSGGSNVAPDKIEAAREVRRKRKQDIPEHILKRISRTSEKHR